MLQLPRMPAATYLISLAHSLGHAHPPTTEEHYNRASSIKRRNYLRGDHQE